MRDSGLCRLDMKHHDKLANRSNWLQDILGYSLWILSLLACLVLSFAGYWLQHEGAILLSVLGAVLLFLWLRFFWTSVVRRRAPPNR